MKALVLAAGNSTRIAAVAQGLPKPLLEIHGTTILEHNLDWLARSGIQEVWINLHYQPEVIRSRIGDGAQWGLSIQYSFESEILGTAGAVKKLGAEWKEPFLVVYGDNLLHFSLPSFQQAHQRGHAVATVALYDYQHHIHTGIAGGRVRLHGEWISAFEEGSSEAFSPYVNAGAYILEPMILEELTHGVFCDFGRDLFPRLLKKNTPIFSHIIEGYCLGVDTPEAYFRALELVRA